MSGLVKALRLRLASKMPVLLDGATATELQRRGFVMEAPLWSAQALLTPEGRAALLEIHREYVEAGADIITANTFRTTRNAVADAHLETSAEELTALAVRIARQAVGQASRRDVLVAGSLAPVADAYRPEDTPPTDQLRRNHQASLASLLEAGVDLIMAETINNWREARVIGELCRQMKAPFIISFVCSSNGLLLSGESYEPVSGFVAEFEPLVVSVNCSDLGATIQTLTYLSAIGNFPLGAYPNIEDRTAAHEEAPGAYLRPNVSAQQFAEFIFESTSRYGLSLIGGCCGTTPKHIAALRDLVKIGAI